MRERTLVVGPLVAGSLAAGSAFVSCGTVGVTMGVEGLSFTSSSSERVTSPLVASGRGLAGVVEGAVSSTEEAAAVLSSIFSGFFSFERNVSKEESALEHEWFEQEVHQQVSYRYQHRGSPWVHPCHWRGSQRASRHPSCRSRWHQLESKTKSEND